MKKYILTCLVFLIGCCFLNVSAVVDAVSLFIPGKWPAGHSSDYNPPKEIIQRDGNYSLLDIIKFVNSYLWLTIWFVCFLFLVINGIKLIVSRWDEQETSKALKSLIWCVIWILICVSAYIIVNVAVRLFA